MSCFQKPSAVFLMFRERSFVRQNVTGAEILDSQQGDKAAADSSIAVPVEIVILGDIDRWPRLCDEELVRLPCVEYFGGFLVNAFFFMIDRIIDPYDVVFVTLVQFLLLFRGNNVVRRRYDLSDISDSWPMVSQCFERFNSSRGGSPSSLDF